MYICGFKIQLIWILSLALSSQAYYFNNGYLAVSESRDEPSTGNYNFEYSENHDNSNSYRRETRKGNRVTGEYGMRLPDGRMRIVKYIADENGYRTVVDSNEPGYRNQNSNNYHNEFERLTEIKALQQQQLKEQQQLLEKQILLQQQVQEEEIKKQENFVRKIKNENYETPLPPQNWSKQKQIENYNRAAQQWILNQKNHLKQQEEAKREAEERQQQLFIQEQIRQQQLVLQQQLWLAKEKSLRQRMEKFEKEKILKENKSTNQQINLQVFENNEKNFAAKNQNNRLEENSFNQNQINSEINISEKLIDDQKNLQQSNQLKKNHQWWNKEEQKIDNKDQNENFEKKTFKEVVVEEVNENSNKENLKSNEENLKVEEELLRINAENKRKDEENQRLQEENRRQKEESLRQLEENQRKNEEYLRQQEENRKRNEEYLRFQEENQRKNEEYLRQQKENQRKYEEKLKLEEERKDFYRESNQNAISNNLQDYSTKNVVRIRVDKNKDSEKRLSWKNFSRIQRLKTNGKTSIRRKLLTETTTKSNEIERESLPTTKKIDINTITTTINSNLKQDDQSTTTTVPTTSTTTINTTTPSVNTTDLNNSTEKEQSTTEKISSDFANSP